MRKLSLQPDPWMRWIYDCGHPDYHSPRAQSLRDARDRALSQCPQWMKDEAAYNDAHGWDEGVSIQPTPEEVAIHIAACTAHLVCCGTEHDPANGKLHGFCVVCGVPWPCETAMKYLTGDTHDRG
jgi:hypothetical protein